MFPFPRTHPAVRCVAPLAEFILVGGLWRRDQPSVALWARSRRRRGDRLFWSAAHTADVVVAGHLGDNRRRLEVFPEEPRRNDIWRNWWFRGDFSPQEVGLV